MKISKRIQSVPVSGIRKMFDLASSDCINLGLGEPDLLPPKEALDGMIAAVESGLNKYGPTAGIPQLREAVAKKYSKYEEIDAGNVMITPSGSSALLEAALTLVDPGDEVLIPSPGFVIYGPQTGFAGGVCKEYKSTEDLLPDIDDIQSKISNKTSVLVVNNPSNPTGAVLDESTYKALADIATDKNITILSDEVYDSFVYEGKHHSYLSYLDNAVVVGGFSKMMSVTGWRLGFVMASHDVMDQMIKTQQHLCACPSTPAMYGALAAMDTVDEYLSDAVAIYKRRRDLIVDRLNAIDGMSISPPKGAFYAFPKYDISMKSDDLCMELAKAGLICTPGSAFGTYGEGHIRFSYAADETKISKGMDILAEIYAKLRK